MAKTIQSLTQEMKQILLASASKKGLLKALDQPSQAKLQSLKEFIPDLEKMIKNAMIELNKVAPQANELNQKMEQLYKIKNSEIKNRDDITKQKENIFKEYTDLNNQLQYCDSDIIGWQNERSEYEERLDSKKRELNSMKGKLAIPFYQFAIIKDFKKLKNHTIPDLENKINECHHNIANREKDKSSLKNQIEHKYKELQTMKETIKMYDSKIGNYDHDIKEIHDEISQNIKSITYLNILKTRLESSLSDGKTIKEVMILLDRDPEIFNYDDNQVYFEILKKWNNHKNENIFEEFIMQSEKAFFAKI